MLMPLNAIVVSGESYPISPFLKDPIPYLERVPSALLAEPVKVVPIAEKSIEKVNSVINFIRWVITAETASEAEKEINTQHDYTAIEKRIGALHALRHGMMTKQCLAFFSNNKALECYEFHKYEPLIRWGIISNDEMRALNAINDLMIENRAKSRYGKDTHFLLKKFPYYPVCTLMQTGTVARNDLFFTVQDLKNTAAGVNTSTLREEILDVLSSEFKNIKKEVQCFTSRCGEYYFRMSKSKSHILAYYYTLVAAKKLCDREYFDHLAVSPAILLDLNYEGKIHTVLVQKRLQGNNDPEYQRQCRRNTKHLLDVALDQFIALNLLLGINFAIKNGQSEILPTVLREGWDEEGRIAIENFEINISTFFRKYDERKRDLHHYRNLLCKNFQSFYNINTLGIFQRRLHPYIFKKMQETYHTDILAKNEEEEERTNNAEEFYLEHSTLENYPQPPDIIQLVSEKRPSEISEQYIVDLIKRIHSFVSQSITSDYELISDKRRMLLETPDEDFMKTGSILMMLSEKKIIAAFYPHSTGYEVYT